MRLDRFPNDPVIEGNKFSRTWNVWLNNLKDLVNFGDPPSKDTEVIATDGIKLLSSKMRIKSNTGGAISITADPQISAGYDGELLDIEGLDNTATVQLNNGNGVVLTAGAAFTFGNNDAMILRFNKVKNLWIERSRTDN